MRTQIMSLLLVLSLGAGAQEDESLQTYLREVMTAEDVESSTWEDVYDQLCYLAQHPFDLNTATRSQLEELPFLSAQQIEEIVDYLYHYGPMKSKGELLMIRSLDEARRRLLSGVCYVGEAPKKSFPRLREILRDGHHELMATARIPFQKKDDTYLGSPLRHWLRYQFNDGDYLKLGLVGSNDAGEPFFADGNRWGYDHYSYYLQLRGLGRLESLCLGHYRVSMGMGLVMNTQTSFGKVALLQTLGRSQTTLRAHASRTDNYLQGAAATIRLSRHFSLTGFFSYRPMDATLNKDGTIASILTSAYHRTQGEMAKKHNLLRPEDRWQPALHLPRSATGTEHRVCPPLPSAEAQHRLALPAALSPGARLLQHEPLLRLYQCPPVAEWRDGYRQGGTSRHDQQCQSAAG